MGHIKTVLLVVNPISGDIDKSDLIELVKKETIKLNARLIIFQTSGGKDDISLEKIINIENPSRIIVAGGDGTIKFVAEALHDKKIPMGIIPAGSANGLAVNLNLPPTLEEQLETALGENFLEMDIISINDEFCLHMGDFGLNAELIKNYSKSKVRGKLGYLLQSIPTLVESEYPFEFQIEVNNRTINTQGILLAIANARSYGTGATVNPNGQINDGLFELLLFKNLNFFEILKTLRNEVDLDPEFLETIVTDKARISCSYPVAFQIDGEYLGEYQSVSVSILPHQIQLAVPLKKVVEEKLLL